MKVIIQRVLNASVSVSNKTISEIDNGYVLLVSISEEDTEEKVFKMAEKILKLRICSDSNQKMNLSITDLDNEILSISQFTLSADCKSGNRPSFKSAMNPHDAQILYNKFNNRLSQSIKVETGIFGADMQVCLVNDGPVTIILDSDEIF